MSDAHVQKVIQSLLRRRSAKSDDLWAWKEKGEWVNVRAVDLNSYIKAEMGEQFSAKDFRTWTATVFAATELARRADTADTVHNRKRDVTAAVKEVADLLGNTPAVCRSSYIDPRVIDRFCAGETILATQHRQGRSRQGVKFRNGVELAVLALLGGVSEQAA